MAETDPPIRLSKVAKEFNVGMNTIVKFLTRKGHDIVANPNTRLSQEMYNLIKHEFYSEKTVKEYARKLFDHKTISIEDDSRIDKKRAQYNLKNLPFIIVLILFLVAPVSGIGLLHLVTLIPYLGTVIQLLLPIIAFFVFMKIGAYGVEKANESKPNKRMFIFGFTFLVCTLTFVIPYLVGYYTHPVKLVQKVNEEKPSNITYSEASDALSQLLNKEMGSDGLFSYALYTERLRLSAKSCGQYIRNQFEAIYDIGDLISAVINIILQTIPIGLKWLFSTKLEWIKEAGVIGLTFWYLFSILLTYLGWKSES